MHTLSKMTLALMIVSKLSLHAMTNTPDQQPEPCEQLEKNDCIVKFICSDNTEFYMQRSVLKQSKKLKLVLALSKTPERAIFFLGQYPYTTKEIIDTIYFCMLITKNIISENNVPEKSNQKIIRAIQNLFSIKQMNVDQQKRHLTECISVSSWLDLRTIAKALCNISLQLDSKSKQEQDASQPKKTPGKKKAKKKRL